MTQGPVSEITCDIDYRGPKPMKIFQVTTLLVGCLQNIFIVSILFYCHSARRSHFARPSSCRSAHFWACPSDWHSWHVTLSHVAYGCGSIDPGPKQETVIEYERIGSSQNVFANWLVIRTMDWKYAEFYLLIMVAKWFEQLEVLLQLILWEALVSAIEWISHKLRHAELR